MEVEESRRGHVVLHAVERLTARPAEIVRRVRALEQSHGAGEPLARAIISTWSTHAAIVGAGTALPAFVPGFGTVATLAVGPVADIVFLLKIESEMCLALAVAHGHDIHDPRERQLALLLAALTTTEARGGPCTLGDAAEVASDSIWNYTPRRIGKLLLTTLGAVAAVSISRSLVRAIPLIGMGVGAATNKVLTKRVGDRAHRELRLRGELAKAAAAPRA